jgi:cobalt-zinc-cadmium efflux system membrane fusion protein
MNKRLLITFLTVISLFFWKTDVIAQEHSEDDGHDHSAHAQEEKPKDEHAGHDHSKHAEEEEEHDDEDHDEHGEEEGHDDDDHDEHGEEDDHDDDDDGDEHAGHDHSADEGEEDLGLEVELTDEAVKIIDLSTATVKKEALSTSIRLTGEVDFNQDRLVHLVPRFPGIAKKINKRLGDLVKANETVAVIESNESLSLFNVKSIIAGTVVEKHITLGEFVSDSEPIYMIADLTNVWVNLAIYPKDIDKVKVGQLVKIKAVGNKTETTGKISYVGKVFDKATRFVTARVVLPNKKDKWRPGMFATGIIEQKGDKKFLAVKNDAIQILFEKTHVFVPETKNIFRAVEVKIGESDSQVTQIISGLKAGEKYVINGAFELKSKVIMSNQSDPHAGHGH